MEALYSSACSRHGGRQPLRRVRASGVPYPKGTHTLECHYSTTSR